MKEVIGNKKKDGKEVGPVDAKVTGVVEEAEKTIAKEMDVEAPEKADMELKLKEKKEESVSCPYCHQILRMFEDQNRRNRKAPKLGSN